MIDAARSKQNWTVGATVRVGWMRLRVVGIRPTPGNYRPDEYDLVDDRNGRAYTFTPHRGIERTA